MGDVVIWEMRKESRLLTETTRSNVGGKHDGTATRLELGEDPITLLLGSIEQVDDAI